MKPAALMNVSIKSVRTRKGRQLKRRGDHLRKHGQTSVLQFLRLHGHEFRRIRGRQAKWVKAKVSRNVTVTKESRLGNRDLRRRDPSDLGTLELTKGDSTNKDDPEPSRDLGKVRDGGSLNGGIKEEAGSFDRFTDQETNDGKHSDAAVGELRLTVSLKGGLVSLRTEA